MRGFQANSLKVAEHVPLKTAFCRFHDNDYMTVLEICHKGSQLIEMFRKISDSS